MRRQQGFGVQVLVVILFVSLGMVMALAVARVISDNDRDRPMTTQELAQVTAEASWPQSKQALQQFLTDHPQPKRRDLMRFRKETFDALAFQEARAATLRQLAGGDR